MFLLAVFSVFLSFLSLSPCFAENGCVLDNSTIDGCVAETSRDYQRDHVHRRIALVIGNGDYKDSVHFKHLINPTNDAEDISKTLRGFGFDVLTGKNLTRHAMKDTISAFGQQARGAEVALFYYAGHGIQNKNQNYLMPVNAQIHDLSDLEDEGINVNYPLEKIDFAGSQVKIIILDACRSNPFDGQFRGGESGDGLAKITKVPKGTVIVYATDPGNAAQDGKGHNGLFTAGLLNALRDKDLSLDGVLTNASKYVVRESLGKQEPYVDGPKIVQKDFNFSVTVAVQLSQGNTTPAEIEERKKIAEEESERTFWQSAQGEPVTCQAYLNHWPNGLYAALAKRCAEKGKSTPPPVVAANSTPSTSPPLVRYDATTAFPEPEMVLVPAGTFMMGSPKSEKGRFADEKQHLVSVPSVYLGKYAVTVGEFRRFVQATGYKTEAENKGNGCFSFDKDDKRSPWKFRTGVSWRAPNKYQENQDNHPVTCVNWSDAQSYAQWLSRETGRQYRLPTEAEWEYAARAGTTTARFWGEEPNDACAYANVADQTELSNGANLAEKHQCNDGHAFVAAVGSYRPNPWGLYDMLGNVWQLTCSAYANPYHGGEQRCQTTGNALRVVRGGSWFYIPRLVRAAGRNYDLSPSFRSADLGFRLARTAF